MIAVSKIIALYMCSSTHSKEVDVIIKMDAFPNVAKDTFQERVDQIASPLGLKFTRRHPQKVDEDEKDPNRFQGLYTQIYDRTLCQRPETVVRQDSGTPPPGPIRYKECTFACLPSLPYGRAVPGYDFNPAMFSGSYNLVWTLGQVEILVIVPSLADEEW